MRVAVPISVAGSGLWLPDGDYPAEQAVAAGVLSHVGVCDGFTRLTVADVEHVPALAVAAARIALAEGDRTPDDVDLVLHAWVNHQGPDTWTPAHSVARELGVRGREALGVQQMSNGGAAALHLGVARMIADPALNTVLVTTADAFATMPHDRWRYLAPLGDGATALLLTRESRGRRLLSVATAGAPELEHSYRFSPEPDEDACAPRQPDQSVIRAMTRCTERAVATALDDAGLDPADPSITAVLVPRLGATTIRFLVAAALPPPLRARIVRTGTTTGHLGAGDLAANLAEHAPPRAGTHHLLVSTGIGYSSTCAVLTGPPAEAA